MPPGRLLWWDMLAVGSLVNLAVSLLALALVVQGAPPVLAVLLHFSPLPYNVLLFRALALAPGRSGAAVLAGALWLLVVTVL